MAFEGEYRPIVSSSPESIQEFVEVKGEDLKIGDMLERTSGLATITGFGNSGQDRVVTLDTGEQFEAEPGETFHILKR